MRSKYRVAWRQAENSRESFYFLFGLKDKTYIFPGEIYHTILTTIYCSHGLHKCDTDTEKQKVKCSLTHRFSTFFYCFILLVCRLLAISQGRQGAHHKNAIRSFLKNQKKLKRYNPFISRRAQKQERVRRHNSVGTTACYKFLGMLIITENSAKESLSISSLKEKDLGTFICFIIIACDPPR